MPVALGRRTKPPGSNTGTARVKPRVLFVDDEPMVLRSLAATLRKHFDVTTACGAPMALEVLRASAFPVVVSDYRMPGMDGAALLACVRDRFPATVRILLSGAGAEGEASTDHDALVFRLLAKPCDRDTLIRAIEDALAHWRASAAMAAGSATMSPSHTQGR